MSKTWEPEWTEPPAETLDALVRWGNFGADAVVINGRRDGRFAVPADETRAAVRAALRLLLANGLIQAVPLAPDQAVALAPPGGWMP
jgi:hypothetical protein